MLTELNTNAFLPENSVEISGRIWHVEDDFQNEGYKLIFISDGPDFKLCKIKSDNPQLENLSVETYVKVNGIVKQNSVKSLTDLYVEASNLEIMGKISKSKKTIKDKLPSIRFLFIRQPEIKYLLQIKRKIRKYFYEYLEDKGFILVETPIISSFPQNRRKAMKVSVSRSPYLTEREKYLVQKPQFYLDAFAHSFERVYTFSPVFRADHQDSNYFLAEFWLLEVAQLFSNYKDQLNLVEDIIKLTAKNLLNEDLKLIEQLIKFRNLEKIYNEKLTISKISESFWENVDLEISNHIKFMKNLNKPFPRIKYSHAVELLKKEEEYSQTSHIGERKGDILTSKYNNPVFITEFPFSLRKFYHKKCPQNLSNTHTFDLIGNGGFGEIASGGESESDADTIKQQILEKKFRFENNHTLQWFHKMNQFGSVPHSGFSIGLERITAWFTNSNHINKTIGFPRRLVGSDIQY